MYKYTCPICQIEFEKKNKGRKYCSRKCLGEAKKDVEVKGTKLCGSCKIEKDGKEFWKRKDSVNGYHWQCIECEKKKRQLPEFREKYRTYARKKKRIKFGLDPDFEGKYKKRRNIEKWKQTNKNGYVIIHRPNHPNCRKMKDNSGRIFEHVFIMAEYLGRPLTVKERIHHKNGVRDDNRIENLELWHMGQPAGQRVEDKIAWCKEFLDQYGFDVIKR